MPIMPTPPQHDAIERLLRLAAGDTGPCRRVADFLLAWWNARECGGFDLTDLWCVDLPIAQDMITVFTYVATCQTYPDALGYGPQFDRLITLWRHPKRRPKGGEQ